MDKIILYFLIILLSTSYGCEREEYYSIDDFKNIVKIDTHIHLNTLQPVLPDKASEYNYRVLTVNVGSDSYPPIRKQRDVAVEFINRYEDRVSFLTTIPMEHWNEPEVWQQNTIRYLKESFADGAIGVKVWKNIGMEFKDVNDQFVMIDDPQFDPVFEFLVEHDKPLLGHIGEPRSCWQPLDEMEINFVKDYYENHPQYHMYLHPENPTYEEIIESKNNMLDKHPKLTFIGAHLGSMSWSIEMMSEHLDRYPNMKFDMAHRITFLQYLTQQNRDAVRNFLIEYQDRLVYSTDIQHHVHSDPEEIRELAHKTWKQDWEYFVTDNTMVDTLVNETPFQGLKLPKQVIDKLYRQNAEKTFPGI